MFTPSLLASVGLIVFVNVAALVGLAALLLTLRLITHTFSITWTRSGESLSQTVTVEAAGEQNGSVAVVAGATNQELDITADVSAMKSLYIQANQDLTLKTNSTSVPDNTLNIKANKPMTWFTGCGYNNPLTVDVTKIYITNATSEDAQIDIRILEDTTV